MTIACPCGSGFALQDCCGPIIDSIAAPTPEALMRSRYTAFIQKNLDYLERTHAPEIKADFNRAEAERVAAEVEWLGLNIQHTTENGDVGTVQFTIHFRRNQQELTQNELSRFRRIDGFWFYEGGDVSAKPPPRHVVKINRNDPCTCGSGKKYKKCCGA